jgi:hypothetical protein
MSRCVCGLVDEYGLPTECVRHQPEPEPFDSDETPWTP